ncbi:LysR family transcriptional regulator [Clostridium neonatale]|uniref:DNA-binding transcriptional LysR family regulator n=1 Tax=Clostridium neonatale TaxID=137838 RepID=A0AAD1YCQ6_9CLOT|nr:LysR family transcriptional regulator [Clostridium neonatale]CAI3199510.1 putative DNA-binding transcriptional LysR family regulator [Clostridium neonatale]CAI3212609.1 putative DNA-binding transcriptional LysR family regulator [Clostridium neonatale]CAI3216374.1 putative DNA-binding transcriptional LysR family regulator [Clostridium neonatale]CAI3224098.1 putative DNA-binding transcriptional LysR family regulator [Clostridium neonatale]CAI3246155.1 putative DNA-binding transcriptional LysR
MDMLQIKYFKIVAQTQNISKAAQIVYISQSSLSQTIQHLEKELGYPLFDRVGRHIHLNANGEIFWEFVNKLEQGYTSMLTQMEEMNEKYQQTIKMDIQCASLYLPQILTYLKEELPDVLLGVTQRNHDIPSDADSDIKIYASPELEEENNIELLLEENILLALPQKHSLLNKKNIYLVDLEEEEFICLNDSWSLQKMIEEQYKNRGVQLSTSIQLDNPDILRHLLCKNLGVAFVPEKTWGVDFARGMLELRTIADFSIRRYVYISWKTGYLAQNTKKCITLIKDFFQKL